MTRNRKSILSFGAMALALLLGAGAAQAQVTPEDIGSLVAVGDSLTSLHEASQDTSWPNLLYEATGRTGLDQPIVGAPGIPAVLQLFSLDPLVIRPVPGMGRPKNLNLPRPYNNLAVPGAARG